MSHPTHLRDRRATVFGALLRVLGCVMASLAVTLGSVASASADSLAEAMRLLPEDAVGAIVVPDLKRANDELASCLERMDRPEAFFVGRPIDLLKAQFGMSVGVRDTGALVAILRWPEEKAQPLPVLLIPVSDGPAFIAGNFVRDADGTLRTSSGEQVHALDLERWVAVSAHRAALEGIGLGEADDTSALERWQTRLGTRATALLGGEIIAWMDGEALRWIAASVERAELAPIFEGLVPGARSGVPALATPPALQLDGLDLAAMSIDLDALGVSVHGALRYAEESAVGIALREPATVMPSLSRLPDATPYWALSVHVASLAPVLRALAPAPGLDDETIALLDGIVGVQWGCWPSRLGVAVGGLLNDSSLLILHPDPSALRERLLERLAAVAGESEGMVVEVQIDRDRALRSGGSADAFEVRDRVNPDVVNASVAATHSAVRSALFGNRGAHGLVRTVPDGVVVTFSQRPDVLRRAVDAGVAAPALHESPVVVAMREFMVDRPVLEGYLGVAELVGVARQMAAMFGAAGVIPEVDAGAEPIGVALAIDDATLLGSTVVPAGVLGAMLDQALRLR